MEVSFPGCVSLTLFGQLDVEFHSKTKMVKGKYFEIFLVGGKQLKNPVFFLKLSLQMPTEIKIKFPVGRNWKYI